MKLEPSKEVRIVVTHSDCKKISEGGTFFLKGPILDCADSSGVCVTALLAIYPWIFASRFGIRSEDLEWDNGYRVWCPEKLVEFAITTIEPS